MLSIQDLHKSYGLQTLFDGISLQMTPGERLGLVGRNGHGKTTLFKMILGQEEPDSGNISFPKNYRLGYLAQHLEFSEPTILQEACLGLAPEERDDFYKAEIILFGLGFSADDMTKPPSEFSGGFQVRLNLAKVLLSKPNLLLLDEPTNYLDIVSMRWLVKYLRSWENEMIIISHDRDFLDDVTTHTAMIHRHKLRRIEGDTSKLYNQILQDEEVYEKTRINDDKKRKQMDAFIDRFRAKASKASVVQSRIKMRDKLPSLDKLSTIESLDFKFHHLPFPSKRLMEIDDLCFGYDADSPLFSHFDLLIGREDRIGIIGKNGKGKSTLLNLLAGELKPTHGSIKKHEQTTIGYFGQTNINRLDPKLTIEQEILASNPELGRTAVRNICGTMMFEGDRAEKEISVLSGGERSRVMLGKILAKPANLLFLDEPTNHLDMESIQALTESIQDYPGAVLIVTHSEVILRQLVNKLIIFQHGGIEIFNGDYDEFLEKIGWEDEEPKQKKKKSKAAKIREQEITQQKEDTKALKKRKKQMAEIEKQISKLEAKLTDKNQEMVTASQNGNAHDIRKISEDIHQTQLQIESYYDDLAKLDEGL